jgi:hypothetical protein
MMLFMKRPVSAALLLCATCVLGAQTHRSQSTKSTYVSPDETFRFDYSDPLVQCKRDLNQPDWWIPAESCEAYTPVCSDVSCDSKSTVACTAYAVSDKKGTNFEAAAFSVSEPKGANTENKCRSVAEEFRTVPIRTQTINGVKFSVTETDGVGTGHGMAGLVYSTFHQGKCYELDIRMASTSDGYSDVPLKHFDFEKAQRTLKTALDSFTFLK